MKNKLNDIYTLEEPKNANLCSIFLAGVTSRETNKNSWRKQAINLLRKNGFKGNVFIPEFKNDIKPKGWTYEKQIDWELKHLKIADIILFWIPRDLKKLPGFTTNIEFGEWLKSGKIVVGSPRDAEKNRYLQRRIELLNQKWFYDLRELVKETLRKINKITFEENNIWFTSDTHFSQKRTLLLSKRSFKNIEEMDKILIKNWNSVVKENDIVYHLGDFGNHHIVKKLNGKIKLIIGNYEIDKHFGNLSLLESREIEVLGKEYVLELSREKFLLIHEPTRYFSSKNRDLFALFGHIHKLQMIKSFGLNVGVDVHNFTPINLETILFYKNAIENHYDENVFI